jgi:hypothetical protein
MIRPLSDQERALWNREQPGARVTTDLQAENNPRANLRASHIRRLAITAQGLAAFHQLRSNVKALQAELDRISKDVNA